MDFIATIKALWPLKPSVWANMLSLDLDWPFICRVLQHGVSIVHPGRVPDAALCSNYKSYLSNVTACDKVFASELARALVVPAPEWYSAQWLHPLGTVPKKNGDVRIIHDCSAPHGNSLNNHQSFLHMPWASIDQVLQKVTPKCYMAGIDIKEYYRNFGVGPVCWPLQSYASADGMVIIDSRLQFGHRLVLKVLT